MHKGSGGGYPGGGGRRQHPGAPCIENVTWVVCEYCGSEIRPNTPSSPPPGAGQPAFQHAQALPTHPYRRRGSSWAPAPGSSITRITRSRSAAPPPCTCRGKGPSTGTWPICVLYLHTRWVHFQRHGCLSEPQTNPGRTRRPMSVRGAHGY
jgi:hypothetical protein